MNIAPIDQNVNKVTVKICNTALCCSVMILLTVQVFGHVTVWLIAFSWTSLVPWFFALTTNIGAVYQWGYYCDATGTLFTAPMHGSKVIKVDGIQSSYWVFILVIFKTRNIPKHFEILCISKDEQVDLDVKIKLLRFTRWGFLSIVLKLELDRGTE